MAASGISCRPPGRRCPAWLNRRDEREVVRRVRRGPRLMKSWQALDVESEGTGISRPLSESVNLLGALLGEAIRSRYGDPMLALVEELRLLCKEAAQHRDPARRDAAAARVTTLGLDEL